jgi:hypothetical protein
MGIDADRFCGDKVCFDDGGVGVFEAKILHGEEEVIAGGLEAEAAARKRPRRWSLSDRGPNRGSCAACTPAPFWCIMAP